ncbi:methyltransferase NSUN7 isoform X1 [Pelobates cultripes]|uniref:Methyltransferase NSUN7 isoform X1 n=1 Tax=Pelobates cultripes TaxID=61616 RepID=A0AAD1SJN5_PELCU|nr:methyltransferase NSUN7 isoform X1 [Pelobates cultripes]
MPNLRNSLDLAHSSSLLAGQVPDSSMMTLSSTAEPIVRSLSYLTDKVNYPDHVFINAAKIFQNIHIKRPPDRILVKYANDLEHSIPEFTDEKSQRWSYELAFSALKYQDLLENILLDSGFYYSQLVGDEMTSLAVVMLYDFQDRKFQPRYAYDNDEIIEEVREVEKLLYRYRTKLAASLARSRIKYSAPAIEYILPENVRKEELRASKLPLYAWVNTAKTSLPEVVDVLNSQRFIEVMSPSEMDNYSYCMDKQFENVLIFPPHLKEELNNLDLFIDNKLVLQDKSHCLAAHSLRALMNMDDDIIIANPCPGFTIAHISVLTNQSACNIYVFGIKSETRKQELQELFLNMECRNIKLLHEMFTEIEPSDQRLQKAKIILLQPQCSGSGVSDPVDFILNEQGDTTLLQNFSQGSVPTDKLNHLANQQLLQLNHAMKFSKVQAIMYFTLSVYEEENEHVINQALELNFGNIKGRSYRLGSSIIPFSTTSEPLPAADHFFRIQPSETTNGCFLAILTRERDPVDSAKDVLARAAAKGLLQGIEISSARGDKKKRSKMAASKAIAKPTSITQTNIAEFLKRENSSTSAKESISKQDPLVSQNSQHNISNIQLKKTSKQASFPTAPAAVKNTSYFTAPKVADHQIMFTRQRAEDKMILLKPMQILLPPVSMPLYSDSTVAKVRSPIQCYPRWHSGVRSTLQRAFTPTLSIVGRPKETLPLNALRHPKPWH